MTEDPPPPDKVVAVCVSDVHFSHRPPTFRSEEPSWYGVMERTWEEVNGLSETHKCPIVLAGDVFQVPKEPVELVNFVMRLFRRPVFGIPGQHDLPGHRLADLHKSAYGTLVEAAKITNLGPDAPVFLPGLVLHGFPYGQEITPWEKGSVAPFGLRIAVVHQYVWSNKFAHYPGAPEEGHVSILRTQARGYDVVVCGDNHVGFLSDRVGKKGHRTKVVNCGCLMRRRADERELCPSAWLLHADGAVTRHHLDTSRDVTLSPERCKKKAPTTDLAPFMEELEGLGDTGLDFLEALKEYLATEGAGVGARELIVKLVEARK